MEFLEEKNLNLADIFLLVWKVITLQQADYRMMWGAANSVYILEGLIFLYLTT